MLDFANSFDTSASLAALYLWLMFSYLSVMLNCDLQRMIRESPGLRHVLGVVAFYFLFTVIDPQNTVPVWVTMAKTLLVYGLFVLATKSRWYFAAIALLLLLADQMLKNHIAYVEKTRDPKTPVENDSVPMWKKVRKVLLVMIVIVILAGSLDYYGKQRHDKGAQFRLSIFLLGTGKCAT